MEGIEDQTAWSAALHAIEALGCRLALDDFGNGFSSLARLETIRVEYVKAAACSGDDPVDAHLLKGIGGIARALGNRFAVTSVESSDHLGAALAARADFVQGSYLSRPSPTPLIPPPSSSLLRGL